MLKVVHKQHNNDEKMNFVLPKISKSEKRRRRKVLCVYLSLFTLRPDRVARWNGGPRKMTKIGKHAPNYLPYMRFLMHEISNLLTILGPTIPGTERKSQDYLSCQDDVLVI